MCGIWSKFIGWLASFGIERERQQPTPTPTRDTESRTLPREEGVAENGEVGEHSWRGMDADVSKRELNLITQSSSGIAESPDCYCGMQHHSEDHTADAVLERMHGFCGFRHHDGTDKYPGP